MWGQGGHPKVRLAVFVYNKGDRGRETCGDPHDVQSIEILLQVVLVLVLRAEKEAGAGGGPGLTCAKRRMVSIGKDRYSILYLDTKKVHLSLG